MNLTTIPYFTLLGAIDDLGAKLGRWDRSGDGLLTFPMMGNIDRLVKQGRLREARNDDSLKCWSLP